VGGGAVNAAVAMSRLGLDVATLVKLGRDQRADAVLAHLMREGISTRWVVRDGRAPTGASVLISSHDRNAAIFTFRGANTLLDVSDLRDDALGVDVVYVSSLSNESADAFPAIVARAKAHGALVATNPRVRQLSSRGAAFQEALADIDILAINRSEADVLVPGLIARFGEGGRALPLAHGETPPRLAARGLAGGGHEMTLSAFFDAMRAMGPRFVVVTDGRNGAFLGTREAIHFCPAIVETTVMGTAGAGDAFNSTFTASIALGLKPEEALRTAAVNAAAVVRYADTQTGLLSREQIDAEVAARAEQLSVRTWSH
jgi:ribokinase